MPKTPKSNTKWNARKRPIINSMPSSQITTEYTQLAQKKLELINLQIEGFKQEHDKKMELLDLEIQIKKKELEKLKY